MLFVWNVLECLCRYKKVVNLHLAKQTIIFLLFGHICIIELMQCSYLLVCIWWLYAYEYIRETDLGPISLTVLLTPFAMHVSCHMIAGVTTLLIIHAAFKSNRTKVIVLIVRTHGRFDDIGYVYSLSLLISNTVYLSHMLNCCADIYAMPCKYIKCIYVNKAFWIELKLNFDGILSKIIKIKEIGMALGLMLTFLVMFCCWRKVVSVLAQWDVALYFWKRQCSQTGYLGNAEVHTQKNPVLCSHHVCAYGQ